MYKELVAPLLEITKRSSDILKELYGQELEVLRKDDRSPVTEADKKVNDYIMESLYKLTPNYPIIAEEHKDLVLDKPITSKYFWLVDPLDGTRSFIKKRPDFTVNIALIENDTPKLGFLAAPYYDTTYYTDHNLKAYKIKNGATSHIAVREPGQALEILCSHSHGDPKTDTYIKTLNAGKITFMASSLKFCIIAGGLADIYPRFGPTMEWDTAAGHAILVAAGGKVLTPENTPLTYNKPGFQNPPFIAWGKYLK